MRLRNKPWAKDKIAENPQYVVPNPAEYKGNWKEVFGSENPLHIEVGTGKGQFLVGMAKQNPHINYIGIEMYESVILSALERLIEEELPNLKLLNVDANQLSEFFAKNDVDRVYLNFSDPWPKKRHAKRRLTYKTFLSMYENLLVDGGEIHFKTDNQGLFEYSLTSFSEYGLLLKYISLDLHKSDFEGNVMTEYEEKFSQKGSRIYRCEVKYLNEKD
ncbi:tRNA (guanosine(46)-N7)-methyltransferase TrmB [Priestia megaterium]|jgi:tRNA (guanine-N7-)-methyltransferase|uniref:tRNA (guanine-N(7)-)-methyltransferase n=1 Tax=Priestia megaterium TaxID=1404 RepID=A0A6M6DPR4_PRIMG|nr:tRNA (guanosine(46)-N7)-methyltransferase TrmB [Priestia megaterium]AYE48903.1 tRNA (guanosine(46)-N7)-methyltransferase TrmB [Priestia megaterium NCT-2]KLV33047.1 tRNA (guanine-N7)-methyltransferase [Priestia megaterium]MBU8755841.1 tRNA (guanosine(46)-N7)-methyltransferase TrmB [Priestia megaterium]MBY0197765.1 tRNA (guanosine(46)-N7)-methyltransferase TrmB [Priestia megaterium]MCE4091416.1 tRNA (guanosine(46)-N7)-methyltransferase TrmB [Priestia megaterium]